MKAVVVFLLTILLPLTGTAYSIRSEPFEYITVNYDEADLNGTEPDWIFVSMKPIYDLRDPAEPIIACQVMVEPVYEDHKGIDMVDLSRGYNQIFYDGRWWTLAEFENMAIWEQCQNPLA